ncbi:MAG: hypothetical protein OHM77_01465 [Candidatus Nitricoxidivorans perseverans]|uniref:Uncharacterized protein n=1 Tax=Candidatus Nitricoxidivorans perseverans TaxID=2975601 RepID=A0AA49FML1_9PROT|nr:MAG: hypothetical protein OHM77_01465 [Candidatus Nitricoxidivorans perseverans]
MPPGDNFDQRLLRLEVRRFVSQCHAQEPLIVRSDTLRDVARWANIFVPYQVAEEYEVRDALERIQDLAETRSKEIILGQIEDCLKAEPEVRASRIRQMTDDWTNLSGPLRHLRVWAQKMLEAKERQG